MLLAIKLSDGKSLWIECGWFRTCGVVRNMISNILWLGRVLVLDARWWRPWPVNRNLSVRFPSSSMSLPMPLREAAVFDINFDPSIDKRLHSCGPMRHGDDSWCQLPVGSSRFSGATVKMLLSRLQSWHFVASPVDNEDFSRPCTEGYQ